nr:unnamed protein product [Callosobruchus chinensis]
MNFVSQNPHWEMEWLKDREMAMSRKAGVSSDSDDSKKRRKRKSLNDGTSSKDKKKKKRSKRKRKRSTDSSSSSSSSDSSSDSNTDTSKSIRVAMRNMKQVQSIMNEDLSSKWSVLEKLVEEHKKKEERDRRERGSEEKDDPLINQWMTVSQPPEKDKKLLESLKDRMKQKQVVERARMAEMELKKLEREKRERELADRKQREAREAGEAAERELRKREEEEAVRIRNRDQVRFKTNYRRRRSSSPNRSDDDQYDKQSRNKYRKDSDSRSSHEKHHSRSRSKSPPKSVEQKIENNHQDHKKKPPGPPSYKKLPFIGRMPLFKNKKTAAEKAEEEKGTKEIQKESYDQPRRTRFQPGNLAKAFIPKPDVVCFPKLSSIPPLNLPPPPPTVAQSKMEPMVPKPPEPPTISKEEKSLPEAPPPPKIEGKAEKNLSDDEVLYGESGDAMNPSSMGQYYQDYNMMSYQQYQPPSFNKDPMEAPPPPSNAYTMPLQPPPLPPDDDLAMLGICADDMAAQSF